MTQTQKERPGGGALTSTGEVEASLAHRLAGVPFTARERLLVELAWQAGAEYERARLADGVVELYRADKLDAWARYRDRVAERLAEMQAAAERSGRPEYRGGPVDWETGRPVRRLGVAA